MSKYSFVVSDARDVDIQRICDENPDSQALIVTTPFHKSHALLLLRTEWLAKFDRFGDAIIVNGEGFHIRWGCSRASLNPDGTWVTQNSCYPNRCWRAVAVSFDDLSKIREQIKLALAYKREIKVTVEPLG